MLWFQCSNEFLAAFYCPFFAAGAVKSPNRAGRVNLFDGNPLSHRHIIIEIHTFLAFTEFEVDDEMPDDDEIERRFSILLVNNFRLFCFACENTLACITKSTFLIFSSRKKWHFPPKEQLNSSKVQKRTSGRWSKPRYQYCFSAVLLVYCSGKNKMFGLNFLQIVFLLTVTRENPTIVKYFNWIKSHVAVSRQVLQPKILHSATYYAGATRLMTLL